MSAMPVSVPPTGEVQKFHPWITENPVQNAKSLQQRALAYNVLSKITFVAVAAIAFAVLIVSMTSGLVTGGFVPFVLVGLIFSTPVLAIASSRFQTKRLELERAVEAEKAVAAEYEKIQNWSDSQVTTFFAEQRIVPHASVSPHTFLPLIARYQALTKEAQEKREESKRLLDANGERWTNNKTESERSALILASRRIGWDLLEQEAIPAALHAAAARQLFSEPDRQSLLPGDVDKKTFEQRQFERLFPDPDTHQTNDSYFFYWNLGTTRPPLTLQEILDTDLSPVTLQEKLFQTVST